MAIVGHDPKLFEWLIAACGLDKDAAQVRRIVIDAQIDNIVKVYIEGYATDKILEVKPPDLRGAEITVLEKTPKRGIEDFGPSI